MANKTIYPYGTGGQLPSGIAIVDDLTTGGSDKALSAEQGKVLGEMLLGGQGTFASAYDKARANTTHFFPWLLQDTDENGDTITKMMWHIGNKKFIDAVGSEINGTKNGLTVVVSQACDMVINGNTIPLVAGENNFTAAELGIVNNGVTSNITPEIYIYQSGTETTAKSLLTYLDFGGLTLQLSTTRVMDGFTGLTKLKRCDIKATSYFTYIFQNCSSLKEATMTGTVSNVGYWGFFPSCTLLETADLSGLSVAGGANTNTISTLFLNCSALKSADVRSFNMSAVKYWFSILKGCSSLKRLDIGGNFSNEGMTSKGTALSGVTGADLFIHSTTPPVLKNCTFTDNTANDEHGLTYDWLSYTDEDVEVCHFRAIYVPDEAVDTYKEDVYVSGGTEGNTGWSYYADIIKGMSEYVE